MSQALDHQLCFLLYANSRSLIKHYKPLLDPYNLTYTQYITLLALWGKDDITFKELGNTLYLDSGTLTPVIKKLEKANFVSKVTNKTDERSIIISLTQQGKEMKKELQHIPNTLAKQLEIPKDEALIMFKHLKKLLQTLNK